MPSPVHECIHARPISLNPADHGLSDSHAAWVTFLVQSSRTKIEVESAPLWLLSAVARGSYDEAANPEKFVLLLGALDLLFTLSFTVKERLAV